MKHYLPVFLCASLLSLPLQAEPLYVKNLSPVAGLFGLPSQRTASVPGDGQWAASMNGAIASHYIDETRAGERLHLDGETNRLALTLRYSFAPQWEISLELPWLHHGSGFLDSSIDGWHDFWGMNDGGRSDVPRDQFTYAYIGGEQFLLQDSASGPGDATLAVARQLTDSAEFSALLSLGYKLGTGDEDEFLGSGGDDIYLALQLAGALGTGGSLRWYGQGGYLRAGEGELVARIQERDLWFAGLGLEWQLASAWSLLGQFDAHTAVADSALAGLGDDSLMFTGGLRWRPAAAWVLDFSVVEDIRVETAPDVTFQLGLSYRPGA